MTLNNDALRHVSEPVSDDALVLSKGGAFEEFECLSLRIDGETPGKPGMGPKSANEIRGRAIFSRGVAARISGWFAARGHGYRQYMLPHALMEITNQDMHGWSEDARQTAISYQEALFRALTRINALTEIATKELNAIDSMRRQLKSEQSETAKAREAAEEVKARLREVDPDKVRRETEEKCTQKIQRLADENGILAAELHEVRSQVAKLAEDKKRLRAALNSRSGR